MTTGAKVIYSYPHAGFLFDIRLYHSDGFQRDIEAVMRRVGSTFFFNSGVFTVDERIFDAPGYEAQIAQRCILIFNKTTPTIIINELLGVTAQE